MFVVALISLVYAMMKHHSSKGALQAEAAGEKNFCKKQVAAALTDPYVLVFAFLIGMFHWTNYWDFVIYYVMGGMGVIWCNYQKYKELEKPHHADDGGDQPASCRVGIFACDDRCTAVYVTVPEHGQ